MIPFIVATAVCRYCPGSFCGVAAAKMYEMEPVEAKAAAALFGIMEAHKRGFHDIIIEDSSTIVTNAIRSYPRQVEWKIHETIGVTIPVFLRIWRISLGCQLQ